MWCQRHVAGSRAASTRLCTPDGREPGCAGQKHTVNRNSARQQQQERLCDASAMQGSDCAATLDNFVARTAALLPFWQIALVLEHLQAQQQCFLGSMRWSRPAKQASQLSMRQLRDTAIKHQQH